MSLFHKYETKEELIQEVTDWDCIDEFDLDSDYIELELAEWIADRCGGICSEEMLSDMFDQMLDEFGIDFSEDIVALNEEFSNYADMLCKDGNIHPSQYENYEYAGKYK